MTDKTKITAPAPDRWLSITDMAAYLRCSKSSIYRLTKAGKIPHPIALTGDLKLWDKHKVDAYILGGSTDSTAAEAKAESEQA